MQRVFFSIILMSIILATSCSKTKCDETCDYFKSEFSGGPKETQFFFPQIEKGACRPQEEIMNMNLAGLPFSSLGKCEQDGMMCDCKLKNGAYYLDWATDEELNEARLQKLMRMDIPLREEMLKSLMFKLAECDYDSDCVPATCCHPTEVLHKDYSLDCSITGCTDECSGPLDCGCGEPACIEGVCKIIKLSNKSYCS